MDKQRPEQSDRVPTSVAGSSVLPQQVGGCQAHADHKDQIQGTARDDPSDSDDTYDARTKRIVLYLLVRQALGGARQDNVCVGSEREAHSRRLEG